MRVHNALRSTLSSRHRLQIMRTFLESIRAARRVFAISPVINRILRQHDYLFEHYYLRCRALESRDESLFASAVGSSNLNLYVFNAINIRSLVCKTETGLIFRMLRDKLILSRLARLYDHIKVDSGLYGDDCIDVKQCQDLRSKVIMNNK